MASKEVGPKRKEVGQRRRTRGNGEGAVYEEKSRKLWRGVVTIGYDADGKQLRRTVSAKTKRDVLAKMRELQNAVDGGLDLAPSTLTVGKFLQRWLDDVIPGTIAPSTEQGYRLIVRLYIAPHIGQVRLRTLQARHVTRMLHDLETAGLSPNTRRIVRSTLRRALRWAEAEGMVPRNDAPIASGHKEPRRQGTPLTPEQARQLLAHVAGDRMEAAFTVALALGLRRGELLALAWDDADLDAARILVHRNLTRGTEGLVLGDTKTAGSRRTLHLPAPVVDSLRAHRKRQAEERLAIGPDWPERPLGADLVFRSPLGTPFDPANFYHLVQTATVGAGIGKWTPHQLRHSAASLLIAQDVPLKLVSEVLGHSSIRMTADVYGHLYDDAGAVAADAMTAALWGT
jgi:integrase